jgi:hypothetical protein
VRQYLDTEDAAALDAKEPTSQEDSILEQIKKLVSIKDCFLLLYRTK